MAWRRGWCAGCAHGCTADHAAVLVRAHAVGVARERPSVGHWHVVADEHVVLEAIGCASSASPAFREAVGTSGLKPGIVLPYWGTVALAPRLSSALDPSAPAARAENMRTERRSNVVIGILLFLEVGTIACCAS